MVTAQDVKNVIARGLVKLQRYYNEAEVSIVFRISNEDKLLYIPKTTNTYHKPVSLVFLIGLNVYNLLVGTKITALLKRLAKIEKQETQDIMLLGCFKNKDEVFIGLYSKTGFIRELNDDELIISL